MEQEIIKILKKIGIEYALTLPCEKIKTLLNLIPKNFKEIQLTKEEEGIGISAGLSLTEKKSIMIIQSSGIGNSINAICSLTKTYELPLPLILSYRGFYKEEIPAQLLFGKYLPKILEAMEIEFSLIKDKEDIYLIENLKECFEKNKIHAVLISPKVFSFSNFIEKKKERKKRKINLKYKREIKKPLLTRYEIINSLKKYLEGKVVVSNLGNPSKELFSIKDQESNFYMLGSFGLVSSISLGISLGTEKEVIAIEGDGSIMTNTNILYNVAKHGRNLTILAIDNSVYGSTGNQYTPTHDLIDLELIANAFGIKNTFKVYTKKELINAMNNRKEITFIHAIAKIGNKKTNNINLTPLKIKERVMNFIGDKNV